MGMTANLLRISKEQLAEMQTEPSLVDALVMDAIQGNVGAGDCLDLYKAWDALDALLNDGEWGAAADAVMGGTPIGEETGIGPARMLDENEVAEISIALSKIQTSDFESRFDANKMTDVYAFNPEDAEDEWMNISDLFVELKQFYASTAEQSGGMLLYLV